MSDKLPRLNYGFSIVDASGRAQIGFTRLWDKFASQIEARIFAPNSTGIVVAMGGADAVARSIVAGTGINVANGSGVAGNPAISMADTAVTPGQYGNSTSVAGFTVDQQGRLVGAANVAIAFPVVSVFGRVGAVVAANGDYSFAQISGSLAASQTPAYTGDVTKPAGSGVTTLANIPAISGANLTNLNASNLSSGTLPSARVSGAYTGITSVGTLTGGAIGAGFTVIPNSALANSSMTIAGHLVALGGTQALAASDLTNGVQNTGAVILGGEGTFSAGLAASTSGTITVAANTCYWQRVGNRVFVNGLVTVASVSSPLGGLSLTGLPVAAANVTGNFATFDLSLDAANGSTNFTLWTRLSPNTSVLLIYKMVANVLTDMAADMKAGTDIYFSGNYKI